MSECLPKTPPTVIPYRPSRARVAAASAVFGVCAAAVSAALGGLRETIPVPAASVSVPGAADAGDVARPGRKGDVLRTPQQRFADAQAVFDSARQIAQATGGESIEARAKFHEAAVQFAAIAADGVRSANLCVNAGNAFHFAGDDPRALLWYLRASRLANTPETRSGLLTLRRVCGVELWPPERGSIGRVLMSWHYDVGRRTKQWLVLTAYPLGCLLLIVARFVRRRTALIRLGAVLLLAGAVMGVSDIVTAVMPGDRWAVVLENARGYAGDGETYSVVVDRIVPGQEVKIVETREGWWRVRLPSGVACWIPAGTCDEV